MMTEGLWIVNMTWEIFLVYGLGVCDVWQTALAGES